MLKMLTNDVDGKEEKMEKNRDKTTAMIKREEAKKHFLSWRKTQKRNEI